MVLSSCALAFGGLLLLGGRAADLAGRRRVFMAGALTILLGTVAFGVPFVLTRYAQQVLGPLGVPSSRPSPSPAPSTTGPRTRARARSSR